MTYLIYADDEKIRFSLVLAAIALHVRLIEIGNCTNDNMYYSLILNMKSKGSVDPASGCVMAGAQEKVIFRSR